MKIRRAKTGVYYIQLLASYIMLFLLPLIILILFYYSFFLNFFENTLIDEHINQLKSVQTEINSNIENLSSLAFQLSYNKSFIYNLKQSNQYFKYKNMNILSTYNTSTDFVYDIFVYNKNTECFTGTKSSFYASEFNKTFYLFQSWKHKDFINNLNELNCAIYNKFENIQLRPNYKLKMATFVYPFFNNNFDGAFLFFINYGSFNKIIEKNIPNDNIMMLMDKELNPFAIYDKDNLLSDTSIDSLISKFKNLRLNQKYFKTTINNQEYLVTFLKSKNEFSYIRLYPLSSLKKILFNMNIKFIILLLLIIILGSSFIYFFIKKNYTPIKKIATLINPSSINNELKTINEGVISLHSKNKLLQEQIESSVIARRNYLLLKLIDGAFTDLTNLNEKGKSFGIHMPYNNFTICFISIDESLEKPILNDIIRYVETTSTKDIICYCKRDDNPLYIVLILNHKELSKHNITLFLENIKKSINNKYNICLTFGVSLPCNKLSELTIYYLQGRKALEYKFIVGKNTINHYRINQNKDDKIKDSTIKNIEKIKRALKSENREELKNYFDMFINDMKNKNNSIFFVHSMCISLINTLIKYIYEFELTYEFDNLEIYQLLDLSSCSDLEEFKDRLYTFLEILPDVKKNKGDQLHKHLLQYVHKNCYDYEFSSQLMADYFQMSTSSLSQYFKGITGHTLSAYIHQLRIDKAKVLLSTTDIPIKQIVSQVGYLDNSSFTRMFKQHTDVTPSQYRKIY